MRYILNSAVITTPGYYNYTIVPVLYMKNWLEDSPYTSTIGYAETAEALSLLTGHNIPVNRVQIKMQTGDEALIFRLTCRLEDVRQKGKLTPAFILANCEVGILIRLG